MRTPIVAGNWKMNRTPQEGAALASEVLDLIGAVDPASVDVIICPPFPALMEVACALEGSSVALGAQDLHREDAGAYTGGVSGEMLRACGCRYVLVGHSERRQYEGETVELTANKLAAAHRSGLIPVLCVGENAHERDAGRTGDVIGSQLAPAVEPGPADLIVAYEPVWAIGSGAAAEPADAGEVASFIRQRLRDAHGQSIAGRIRILYGGSVNPGNITGFLAQDDVDGVLVGGASLEAVSFARLVEAAGRKQS